MSDTGWSKYRFVTAVVTGAFLILLFVGGHYVYIHVGGRLFEETHAARTLPPGLLLALAVVGGAASFFSPCSLAITPSFLVYFIGRGDQDREGRRLLRGSALVALGIVVFYALAGLLVSLVGATIYNVLVDLIPIAGVAFLALGALILLGQSHRLDGLGRWNPVQPYYKSLVERPRPQGPFALFGFGMVYGGASHTCTLPIFLGIVLMPIAAGDYWLAGSAVAVYGVAIAGLLLTMAYLGQNTLIGVRRVAGRFLQQAAGWLFILTSIYLFHYFALNYGLSF